MKYKMDIYIIYVAIFFLISQHYIVSASGNRHDSEEDPPPMNNMNQDQQDLSEHCIYFRYDHNTRFTDIMLCPFGCCGDLDDQKCCEDLEEPNDDKRANPQLVHGLLIFAGVMLVIALSCCGFGIYKHKKAKLRKTHPAKDYAMPAPTSRTVYYTPGSGLDYIDTGSKRSPERMPSTGIPDKDTNTRTVVQTPPPLYSEVPDQPEMPPSLVGIPPPPYSFGLPTAPPTLTEFRGSN